jgi:hypothetical protein
MKFWQYIGLVCLGAISCSKPVDANLEKTVGVIQITTTQKEFIAGEAIILQFNGEKENQLLLIQNGWSTIAIPADSTQTSLTFSLPATVAQKSGWVQWKLIGNETITATGDFFIRPSTTLAVSMETYLGPTSIFADKKDQAMIVSLPQDKFGNPMPDSTQITLTEKFKSDQKSTTTSVQDMISFAYVGNKASVGELFIGSHLENQISKEFTVSVLPTKAADFAINFERQHNYSDGNQIVFFTTSTIRDFNGNIVADGTLVNFVVEDASGNSLQTYGTTLNGVATGKMLHPEVATEWKVKAHISGLSQSNSLTLNFDAAVMDYVVDSSEDGRFISVGPILSYMGQWVPDGMGIQLEMQDSDGKSVLTLSSTTRKGMGTFELPEGINANTHKGFVIVAGIKKSVNHKTE